MQAMADPEKIAISIHALREEGDSFLTCKVYNMHKFLSTPSARRATRVASWPAPS